MSDTEEKMAFGCFVLWALFAVAWVGFIAWLLYTVVTWLVTK